MNATIVDYTQKFLKLSSTKEGQEEKNTPQIAAVIKTKDGKQYYITKETASAKGWLNGNGTFNTDKITSLNQEELKKNFLDVDENLKDQVDKYNKNSFNGFPKGSKYAETAPQTNTQVNPATMERLNKWNNGFPVNEEDIQYMKKVYPGKTMEEIADILESQK